MTVCVDPTGCTRIPWPTALNAIQRYQNGVNNFKAANFLFVGNERSFRTGLEYALDILRSVYQKQLFSNEVSSGADDWEV